jgi:hypothetical protein
MKRITNGDADACLSKVPDFRAECVSSQFLIYAHPEIFRVSLRRDTLSRCQLDVRSGMMAKIDMPWDEAIKLVLSQANGPLHYTDIADRIFQQGLRHNVGATPANTVNAIINNSLKEGKNSPYLRLGRGQYTLKVTADENTRAATVTVKNLDQEEEVGALGAFGMFWQRDLVFWPRKPQLLGRQSAGATDINFAGQIGVYLLHDRERVIYVGKATDSLFARLKAHTADRLGGRWDRFSWFGLCGVRDNGELSDGEINWNRRVLVETMEAVLIESLEPPLNRRRGDNLSGAEYIQTPDPQIVKAKNKALLDELTKGAGLE